MAGPVGREIFGAAQIIFFVFVMGSHILTFSIMMNAISGHGTCTIVFGVVGLIVSLICTMPRTLKRVSLLATVSFVSILAALLVTMIGVSIEKHGSGQVQATVDTSLYKGFLAVANIIFAYAGESTISNSLSIYSMRIN